MTQVIEITVAVLLVLGGAFIAIGAIALVRMPDFYTRLHGPTKATTLGMGAIIMALILHSVAIDGRLEPGEAAISLFLFITAPVVAHVLAKAAIRTIGRPKI